MKTRWWLLYLAFSFGGSFAAAAAFEPRDGKGDRLTRVNNPEDVGGSLEAYRTFWQKKLLVTPGDVARFVWLPGLTGEESSMSIYRANKAGEPNHYVVTGTYASKRLWSYFTPGARLGRADSAPLGEVTLRFLKRVRLLFIGSGSRHCERQDLLRKPAESISIRVPKFILLSMSRAVC